MEKVAALDRPSTWEGISVVLTDDAEIANLNHEHLCKQNVTDVISFRFDPLPGAENGPSGEVIVNVQRAAQTPSRRTRKRGGVWDASRELALYLAHGCNHLTGETDYDEKRRARMRRRELRWLSEADELGLVDSLFKE